jgi:hypothetical protein
MNSNNRHSRAGGSPVQLFNMQLGFVRYAGSLFMLDSRLCGNDKVLGNGEVLGLREYRK